MQRINNTLYFEQWKHLSNIHNTHAVIKKKLCKSQITYLQNMMQYNELTINNRYIGKQA